MPNITIRLPEDELLRRVKVIAVQRGVSVSAMAREYLVELVRREDDYAQAHRNALRMMRNGLSGGGRPLTRDEAHDDRVV